jgi:spermidine/putrescine transport system permease protein
MSSTPRGPERGTVGDGRFGRFRGYLSFGSASIMVPGVLWLVLFYVLPTLVMARYSVLPGSPPGATGPTTFTLDRFFEVLQTSLYARVALKSAGFALLTTVVLLITCYPLAYYLAKKTTRPKQLLILLMIPFWTSQVLRAFAWLILLSRTGVINSVLIDSDILQEPIQLMFSSGAVAIGLTYSYLPYMILPLYATIGKIKDPMLEASGDLGASRWRTLWSVTIPLSLPGILSGAAIVFVASFTDVLSPSLLGGPYDQMISSTIFNIFTMGNNWPLGAAVSLMLFVVLLVAASLIMGLNKRVRYQAET